MASICSATLIGTAGLSSLPGNEPVIATAMIQGSDLAMHYQSTWSVSQRIASGYPLAPSPAITPVATFDTSDR
jgi:hypothetical protein